MGFFTWIKDKITPKANGIWFNQKRKKTDFDKEKYMEAFSELAPTIAKILKDSRGDNSVVSGTSLIHNSAELYDWLSFNHAGFNTINMPMPAFSGINEADGVWVNQQNFQAVPPPPGNFGNLPIQAKTEEPPKRPKEVRKELQEVPQPWTLENLDHKIEIMKDKESLTLQHYANAEIKGMIDRLTNRKKYDSVKEFFEKFPNTTDEKIDDLIKKYPHLKIGKTDLFVPEFPDEAVMAMKQYTQHCKDLCEKSPAFYVIAQKKDFEEKVKRRDPILLVQSPFGMYWQILGAWDEEMVLLSEL